MKWLEGAAPSITPLSRAVIDHSSKVLSLVCAFLLLSAYWAHALAKLKDGLVFIPMDNGALLKGFPATSDPFYEAMVFWCDGCDLSMNPEFVRYRREVEKAMDDLVMKIPKCASLEWSSVGKPMPGVPANFYISADRTTSFMEIHASKVRCMLNVRQELKQYRRSTGSLLMSAGGPETVADASMSAEFRTALRHSVFAVPVCGFMLWLVIGNVFRAGTPMLCTGAAYLSGKGLVGFCKTCCPSLNINFDDSCVLFIVLALCVDYGLFLWSRFNEEMNTPGDGSTYRKALEAALHHSGTVILVSNCFVTLAYGCTMLLPYMNLWAYLGLYIQAMGGCAMAGVYSVVLTPSLAGAFPKLFDDGCDPSTPVHRAIWSRMPAPQTVWKAWARAITRGPLMVLIPLLAYGCMLPFVSLLWRYRPSFDIEVQGSRHDIIEQKALARFENHFSLGLLYPVTFVLEAMPLGPTGGSSPRSQHADLLQTAWSHGGAPPRKAGRLRRKSARQEPLALTEQQSWTTGAAAGGIFNVALSLGFGNATCQLAEQLLRETRGRDCELRPDEVLGLWWMPPPQASPGSPPGPHRCTVSSPAALMVSGFQAIGDPISRIPRQLKQQMPTALQESLSLDGKRLLLKVMPSFRPTSPEAYSLDRIIRESILKKERTFESGGQRYVLRVKHTSSMQIQVDASQGLSAAVPKVLGIFAPLAAITIGATFSSVFLAFKLALTVIVPIIATYGMAIAVYQLGWLDCLGVEMLRGAGGLDFRMMILTAGILFGFAMDYDLFLFVRVFEHRAEGYDNRSAVKRALVETGPVITTAGTMMVVSFFFIMCSHTIFLRTMGFIFTVGVLFDVYIIRTMIAPVFLSFAENLNYWPRKMPTPTKAWD